MADDSSRAAILARRSGFIALALAGATTAVSATACACLSPPDPADTPSDAGTNEDAPGQDASSTPKP